MSCDGLEDLFGDFGPQEWAGMGVPVGDPGADVGSSDWTLLWTPRRII
jgi:hypothetical protein